MKYSLLFLPLLALAKPLAAQHTELIGRAGLGLSRFGGRDAAAVSGVSYYDDYLGQGASGFAYKPYGRKLGPGFSLGGRIQRVGQQKGLLALEIGYEQLRSRALVNQIDYSSSIFSSYRIRYPAEGSVRVISQNLTAFLGLGHRVALGDLNLDVLAGPEVAYVFDIRQKGSGTYNNSSAWAVANANVASNRVDARLRADATIWYNKLGITASYSYGLISYENDLDGSDPKVYSRTLRLGLAYRVK